MPRGCHTFPFEFKLPESALPCSFESKYGTVRYYIRVTLDIPYASCPQGVKYFTIIGPHIDCMDERLLVSGRWGRLAGCMARWMCGWMKGWIVDVWLDERVDRGWVDG